jgi:hypothetical protein
MMTWSHVMKITDKFLQEKAAHVMIRSDDGRIDRDDYGYQVRVAVPKL